MPRKRRGPRRAPHRGQALRQRRTSRGAGARLVFEIGTEEMPAQAAWEGLRQLRDGAAEAFAAARIAVGSVRAYATPRRLVLVADGVVPRQEDLVREVRGPAARIAFTPEGRPTQAAAGFARAQGVPVAALERRTTPQGEYVFAIRRERGAPTARVLADLLPSLAGGLAFPRAMRWEAGAVRFARPVRWLVALLGSRIVPCRFGDVRAGRRTAGHRALRPGAVVVPRAETFERVLRRSFVLVDQEVRRRRILAEVARAARAAGGRPIVDPDLLEETVQLVEWPTAFAGRFGPEFLALPREVLITVMQHHQKYFAVEDAAGRLVPAFVAVRNGGARGLRTVREGNEWVLRARLADGRFFFEEDRRRPLETRVGELAGLVFHEKLGTMAEKTRRLEALAAHLERGVHLERPADLQRAAHLSKADLVTQVVREFPELQGVIGGIYAGLDGEPAQVAAAIREQYLPRGAVLPRTEAGAALALLDKLDTLLGGLAAGLAPTGSQDPYGLRRAAQGIVAIVLDRQLSFDIRALAGLALDGYGIGDPAVRADALRGAMEMLRQRVRSALIEQGISYDTVDAVMAARADDLPAGRADDLVDAAARARALWAFRRRPEFARVYTAFDRAVRILPPRFDGQVRPDGLAHAAERALLETVEAARPRVRAAVEARRYDDAFGALAVLADPVDRFFVDVLVMAEDEAVRANRLALLGAVVRLIRPIADLSRVVMGEGKAPGGS